MSIQNTATTYDAMQREAKGYLEIGAEEFYFDKLRPFMQEMLMHCRTDKELIRTLEKVINAADSFCVKKDYTSVMESFIVLEKAINDKNYFNGVIRKASEEEKEMIRKLSDKITDLRLIIKCESPHQPEKEQPRERLNYQRSEFSPVGENMDYGTHNMKVLSKPNPKERIPNV